MARNRNRTQRYLDGEEEPRPRRNQVQQDRAQLDEGGGGADPTIAEGETNPQQPARRQRGVNMPDNPNVQMGESGRQELTIRGKRYIRDGSWWVDADALAPYGGDPDAAPPELVERSRMPYAQGLNRARRLNVAAFNDANWQGEAQAAGYGDWRELRRKAMQAYQADPVRFWQMAANGGGGDLTKQPTADDLERFSHWLWITNPANQAEVMAAQANRPRPSSRYPPPAAPPPPPTDPYDPNGKPIQIPGTSPAADAIGGSMGGPSAPPVMPPTPAPGTGIGIGGAKPPQTTRPPVPAGKPPVPSPTDPMTPTKPPVSMGAVGGPTPPQPAPPISAPTNRYQNKLRPMGTLARQPQQRLRPGGF